MRPLTHGNRSFTYDKNGTIHASTKGRIPHVIREKVQKALDRKAAKAQA